METTEKTIRKMDTLSAVEQIVELSKGSHLDADFFKKAAKAGSACPEPGPPPGGGG